MHGMLVLPLGVDGWSMSAMAHLASLAEKLHAACTKAFDACASSDHHFFVCYDGHC